MERRRWTTGGGVLAPGTPCREARSRRGLRPARITPGPAGRRASAGAGLDHLPRSSASGRAASFRAGFLGWAGRPDGAARGQRPPGTRASERAGCARRGARGRATLSSCLLRSSGHAPSQARAAPGPPHSRVVPRGGSGAPRPRSVDGGGVRWRGTAQWSLEGAPSRCQCPRQPSLPLPGGPHTTPGRPCGSHENFVEAPRVDWWRRDV